MRPRVKVCCISSAEEARMAVEAGASALGLVSAMPSGPGVIEEKQIAEIAAQVPPGVATFLLTSETKAGPIIAQQKRTRVNTLQLVDRVEEGTYDRLRESLPGTALVQVIHMTGPESVEEALEIAPAVDAILLDSGNPKLAVKELGGTGRVHNWQLSREIVNGAGRPVFLAGGLRPDNIATAIREVQPFGLDLCSGVRTDGKLDSQKLAAFFEAVENAGVLL